jgi:hypothetical protein
MERTIVNIDLIVLVISCIDKARNCFPFGV